MIEATNGPKKPINTRSKFSGFSFDISRKQAIQVNQTSNKPNQPTNLKMRTFIAGTILAIIATIGLGKWPRGLLLASQSASTTQRLTTRVQFHATGQMRVWLAGPVKPYFEWNLLSLVSVVWFQLPLLQVSDEPISSHNFLRIPISNLIILI